MNAWAPAAATIFAELYHAVNLLRRVRILPTFSEAARRDSVHRMTDGITDWPAERAATFALFDGQDDGQTVALSYDAGMGAQLIDYGSYQHWFLESREFRMVFGTDALAGLQVAAAWLDFSTAPPEGSADYSDAFTAELADADGNPIGEFAGDDYGPKRFTVPPAAVRTDEESVFVIRSTRPDSADRPAWSPPGPDYSGTYREGLAVAGPVRLIVEVNFDFRA